MAKKQCAKPKEADLPAQVNEYTNKKMAGKQTIPQLSCDNTNDIFFNSDLFTQAQRAAKLLSESTMIPDHYRGKMPDCFIALASANRLNIDVFSYMQSSYVVHGRPGIEAKLVIALINTRGPFSGPVQWKMEGEGKDRKCTAYAYHAKTKELCEFTLTWKMVEAEGWNKDAKTKSGHIIKSKWNTLPDLMFRYRSATFLARLYCPEVIQGITTVEELQDIQMVAGSDGVYEIEKEIAENANKTPIDIDSETGEVVDAEFVTEISPAPSVKPKAEENVQPPVGDEKTIEGQEDPEFEPGEDPISVDLKTGKQEKEEKTKKGLKSDPKYVAELNKWLDDVPPKMRYACMEEIKKKRFPNMTVEDQDKVLQHYEELTEAAEQVAEPEF